MQKGHETASIDRNHLPKSELECSEGFELTKADLQGRKEADRDERYVKHVVHNTQHGRRPQRAQIYIIMSIVTKKIIKIHPFKVTTITQRFGERGKSGLKILKRTFYTSKKTEIKDDVLLISSTTKSLAFKMQMCSQRIEIERNTSKEGERSVQIVHGSEAWL